MKKVGSPTWLFMLEHTHMLTIKDCGLSVWYVCVLQVEWARTLLDLDHLIC
jgi:hypothetical protein